MPYCNRCQLKSPEDFYTDSRLSTGLMSSCKLCLSEQKKSDYRANPSIYHSRNLRRYHMTLDEYDARLEEQGGGCAACGTTDPGRRRFLVDHDHACCPAGASCGECIRGLLCNGCNTALGVLENEEKVAMLMAYLEKA